MLIQITTGLAILGAIYVASGRALAANILWSISNPALMVHNLYNGQNEQAAMFAVFSLVSLYGIYYMVRVQHVVWYDAGQWRMFSKKQGCKRNTLTDTLE